MANLKTEVILTMNGKAAIQVLEALRDKAKSVREEIDNLDEKAPDFKQRKAGLEEVYKALQSAETDVIKGTERLDHALQNLTSTSLQNLRKALGDGRRQLQSLSEDDLEEIEEIRKKMKLAGDQVRLLEGQYVKIPDGLKNIKNQSDQWLDKAIKQQRDLVGSLEKSDASYQQNLSTLKLLVAEEDRRKGKMSKNDAMATVSNKYANASELRRAKTTITEVRDKTDSHKVDEIEQYNKALLEIDKRLGSISGQFVDVQKGISNVSNQSDQWLDKAIKQQRDLVGSLEKSDASYQQNLATLKQLEAEEDRRKGKMSEVEARRTASDDNASASDLRRAKATLTEARDKTAVGKTGDIDAYNRDLQEIEKRLEAVSGKAQKASMSWKQMKQVLAEPNKASGEDIKRTMDVIAQKIQQLPAGSKYVATLRRQYAMLEQTLKGTRMSQSALNDILTRSKQGKASIDELRRAYKQLEEELNQLNTKSKEFADKQKSMKQLKKYIDDATGAANKQGGAWRTALKNLTAYVGLFAVFNQLKTYLFDVFRLNAKFAEQLTNIRKVALSTTEEVAQLSKELAKIDTRTSIEELNNLAYAGAKLGITTQNLAGFVRAADQVNVALKEDLGDEALTSLAKITEVMGLVDKYGVEDAMLKTGSAIFRLASTSTACSGKIVDFSNRMLALGDAATLTTPDILAIGSAVDSMALEPEVAATAFGKLVVELRKGTSSIEKDLGIAQGSLKKMIEEGKGMEAIQTIFHKMHESDNVFALNSLFKDLGSEDGARLTKVMVTMAEKVGMLDKAVAESNKAFREGTAVTTEYEMQQETAAAYMERAANLFEKQFVSADMASGPVRDLAKAWYEMVDALVHNVTFMTEVRILITLLMASMKMLLGMLPTLITMLSTAGVAGAFAKLAELTTGLTGKTMSLAKAWNVMYSSFKKLSFVGQMSVMGGLIGLAGTLVVKLAQWSSSLKQVAAGQRVLNEVQEEGQRRAMEEQESLKRLRRVMHDTSASMDLRLEAMKKLNGAIPNLNAKIDSETGAVQENTEAWEENFKRLQDYYELEGARSKLAELGRKKVDAILKLQQKEDAYANTNVDVNPGRPVTSGGAVMGSQAQGAIGQAGQKAAAKRARDKAQKEYDDIVAQEDALYKKFGAKLEGEGKKVGKNKKKVGGGGGGNAENPEDDARANISEFITKIKNFYERQKTAMIEKMTADGVEKDLQDYAVENIEARLHAALAAAKQSLVLGTKAWDDFKGSMDKDLKEKDDEYGLSQSRMLKEAVQSADVMKLRTDLLKQMPKIKKGQIVGLKSDERDRAYLDRVWLEESKSENEQAILGQKWFEQRRKELLEHDYTGVVQQNSFLGLAKTGFVDIDINEIERDRNSIVKVLEKARNNIVDVFQTGGEKDALLKLLFGENYENMPMQFLSLLNESEENVRLFYQKLIQYSDEYAAAEKKQYDDAKKITDFLWKRDKRNIDQQEKLRKIQNEGNLFGKRINLLSNLGLANLTADPEIELMKARMQAAENYYAFVKANTQEKQLIDEAERARQEAELAYVNQMATAMKSRLSQMKELVQPIEDFGAAVGQALAEMRYDAESANDAIKSALKSMLESWGKMALNDVNTQMWKAINDAGAKRGKKNAQPDIEAARANADANAVTMNTSDIGTAGNPAHVIVDNETKPSDSISDKKTDVVVHSGPGGPDALPTVAHKDSPMATSPILVPNNTERHGAGGLFKSVAPDTMPSYPSKDKVSAELPVKIGDDNVVDSHSNSQEKSDLQHESFSRVEEKRKNNFPSDFHPDQYPEITGNSKKESPVPTVDTKTYEPPANAALKCAHNTNNPQNEENREGVVGLSDIQENVRGILEVAKDLQSKVSDGTEGDVGSPAERTEEPDSSANSTSYSDPAHRTKKALPTDAQESQGKVRNSPSNQRKGSTAFRGTAEQAGSSVADAITGQSSLAEAGAGIVMGGVNAALNADLGDSKKKKKEEKQRKKQLREEKKHQKALSKEVKQGTKEREKTTDKGVKNMTATTEQGNKEQSKGTVVAQQTMLGATDTVLNATLVATQKNNDAIVQSDAARTEAGVTFSIAGAIAKCFDFLGPIAGPIAGAVVMSTLMGLLQWALGSAFGGKKKNSTKGPNTKVVSGMLTYDSGNVQDLRPFVGNDGSLYWATEDNKPHDGVSLLTQPTATTINGQPSLVAENGPELVIGRETTQAMMMNNPQLLKALVNYDRNYSGRRAYDNGNIAETSATITPQSPATDEMVSAQANTNIALLQAVNTLLQRLEQPIEAKIDMYGRGKLYDSMTKANQFMKNK